MRADARAQDVNEARSAGPEASETSHLDVASCTEPARVDANIRRPLRKLRQTV